VYFFKYWSFMYKCNILAETNNFVPFTVLSFLFSELQKTPSPRLGQRMIFRGCGLFV
jgi:hypothetical protein